MGTEESVAAPDASCSSCRRQKRHKRNLPLTRGTGPGLNMSSIPSLESIYGSLTADITANTAKLERLGNQTDIVEDEFGEEDNVEKKISKVLTDIEKAKEEAEDVFEQMELEIRGLDAGSAERDRRLNQWQSHRVELRRLIAQVEKSKKTISAKRKRRSLGLDDDSPDVAMEALVVVVAAVVAVLCIVVVVVVVV